MNNIVFNTAKINIGQHWYWRFYILKFHGQTLISSWIIISIILLISLKINKIIKRKPRIFQNIVEFYVEFVSDIAKTQIKGDEYKNWISFLGTFFLFILLANCLGSLLPRHLIRLPNGELSSPTNDINTTIALALLTSLAYFFAGFHKKGFRFFKRYISPIVFLLPIYLLEDITKPLSLSFRLFGNVLADELMIGVLISLVPFIIPIPLMLLGLFTGIIQSLVFTILTGAYIGESLADH